MYLISFFFVRSKTAFFYSVKICISGNEKLQKKINIQLALSATLLLCTLFNIIHTRIYLSCARCDFELILCIYLFCPLKREFRRFGRLEASKLESLECRMV